jgi:hypothetical protein
MLIVGTTQVIPAIYFPLCLGFFGPRGGRRKIAIDTAGLSLIWERVDDPYNGFTWPSARGYSSQEGRGPPGTEEKRAGTVADGWDFLTR